MMRVYLLIALFMVAGLITLGQPLGARASQPQVRNALAQADKPAQPRAKSVPRNLAILVFDGVQIIDYTGPFETFGHVYSEDGPAFNIYTVSEKTNPITTAMGMSVNPKYSFENAPKPDVLLVPGGGVKGQVENPVVIKWVQDTAKDAEIVLSVCNGAFIIAKAGLLDGLEATTTAGLIPALREVAPKVKVVDDRRFVDNGKIITAAGLSSGIDGSLHVIERLFGKGTAQMAALGMEYNWDSDSKFVRAALADKYMRFDFDVKVLEGGWVPLSREGGLDQWENKWLVATDDSAAGILESINKSIAANKTYGAPSELKWNRQGKAWAKGETQSSWTFADEKGAVWNGVARVEPLAGEKNRFTLSLKITRNDARAQAATK
jgi:putative intracellular protease/amidase